MFKHSNTPYNFFKADSLEIIYFNLYLHTQNECECAFHKE